MAENGISVRDYSVRGRWVQVEYPGGKIVLPAKRGLSRVPTRYRKAILSKAQAVCQGNMRRWGKAWKFRFQEEDTHRHLVEFLVEVSVVTTPRTLYKKVQEARFAFVALWWLEGDQLRVMEFERRSLWVNPQNNPNEGELTEDDIPPALVEEMLMAVPDVCSGVADYQDVALVPI